MSRIAIDARAYRRRTPLITGSRLVALAIVLLLAAGAFIGGRAALHYLRTRPTAASHSMSNADLAGLHPVAPAVGSENDSRSYAALPVTLPDTAILPVPYTVQAPFGNWAVHEESCEEAALLMYHDFLEGDRRADLPPGEVDPELRSMKSWQVTNWGAERDLDMNHTGILAHDLWAYEYDVSPATSDSIKKAIAAGHPVVVPVMTHSLHNPNYGPRTVYHELLIKGYRPDGVITNDAGVKEGKDWFYDWDVLFGAIDDQTPKMQQGRLMLVLTKP